MNISTRDFPVLIPLVPLSLCSASAEHGSTSGKAAPLKESISITALTRILGLARQSRPSTSILAELATP